MAHHSKLGASSASRWLNCPGSVKLSETLPPQPSSEYALEGTAAHKLAEICLISKDKDPDDFLGKELQLVDEKDLKKGKKPEFYEVTQGMADAVQVYVEYVRKQKGELNIETQFDLSFIEEGMFGTNDACIYNEQLGILEVIDYKHGAGIAVSPVENTQLAYYGLGAAKIYELHPNSTIKLTVVQPRAMGEAIKTWVTTVGYLDQFAKKLKAGAKATRAKDPKFAEGNWCRFCPAQFMCPLLQEKSLAVAQAEFTAEGAIILPEPENLNPMDISKILNFSGAMISWLKAVHTFAQGKLERGEKVEGFKLVAKRSNRRWKDEGYIIDDILAKATGMDTSAFFTEPKLKSPAQIEAMKIDKNLVATLTVTPDAGTTMAPVDDRRPEVLPSIQTDFSVIEFSE